MSISKTETTRPSHLELVEWWKLGLEYFKVAAGWPLIVLAIAIVLRKPLGGLLRRDLEAEAAGVRLRVGRAEEAVEQALEDAAQLEQSTAANTEKPDTTPIESEHPEAANASALLSAKISELESRLQAAVAHRTALERLLAEGARLGWEWARAGEAAPPKLLVEWDDDGGARVYTERNMRQHLAISASDYQRRAIHKISTQLSARVVRIAGSSDPVEAYIDAPDRIGLVFVYTPPGTSLYATIVKNLLARLPASFPLVLIISNRRPGRLITDSLKEANAATNIRIGWTTWEGDPNDDRLLVQIAQFLAAVDNKTRPDRTSSDD